MTVRHTSEEGLSYPQSAKSFRGYSISKKGTKISDVPDKISVTSIVASEVNRPFGNGAASVNFTPATTGGVATTYTAVSSPGSLTGTATVGATFVAVEGLSGGQNYTFTVTPSNSTGTGSSLVTNSVTATTIPAAPVLGTVTVIDSTRVSVPFTAPNNGGSTITSYIATSSPALTGGVSVSGTASPVTVTGTFLGGVAYTISLAAVNANTTGTWSYGTAGNTVTPVVAPTVTGGTLTSDATYYYRTFTANGTLAVANSPVTMDVMMVAGGGGGGSCKTAWNETGGGGGAGGLRYTAAASLAAASYAVVIGGGGAGNIPAGAGGQGADGTVTTLIGGSISYSATGGGGGGGYYNAGRAGGSGGGGGASGNYPGGTGVSGQGYRGGNTTGTYFSGASGGGGAGAVGSDVGNAVQPGGNGGVGSSAYSSWGSVTSSGQNVSGTYYYAGGGGGSDGVNGGGGGTGGYGGGANKTVSGTTNTGGGGGGNRGNGNAGNGGSGIFIVRYTRSQVGG
jgi:hypothetical protein